MYVDFDIPVCQKLPKRVLRDIEQLDEYYRNDDLRYMQLEESVEVDLKNCCEERIITGDEFKEMCRRFGWR